MRRVRGGGPALVRLAVEHPQRVLQVPRPVRRAQLVGPLGQERAQQRDVARLADAVAHGVQLERHLRAARGRRRSRGPARRPRRRGRRPPAPSASTPELVVLAVAAVLGVLVAERRRHVPGLPRRHRVVLHEGPGDRARSPRGAAPSSGRRGPRRRTSPCRPPRCPRRCPRRNTPACSRIGRDGQPVAGALDQRGEAGDRSLPAGGLGPEHVVHALRACGPPGRGGRDPARRDRPRAVTGGSSRVGGQPFLPGS